jgi:hypothetical protein
VGVGLAGEDDVAPFATEMSVLIDLVPLGHAGPE